MAYIYEINTALWLGELSRKYSKEITLGTVPSREWDKLKKYRSDYVWLMGVWKRSPSGRKIAQQAVENFADYGAALPGWTDADIAGSPYSTFTYEPDPLTGTWEDLQTAREQLSKRGMGMVLDFVSNHTGIDCPWVRRSPDNYLQADEAAFRQHADWFFPVTKSGGGTSFFAKGRDPFFPPWNDTLQLDYFSTSYRSAAKRLIRKISKYCDGLRCDMAMLGLHDIYTKTWGPVLRNDPPSDEFWKEIIASSPHLLWIAESYWNTEWVLQQLGFDFTYDKVFYDRARSARARDMLLHLQADTGYQNKLVRFLENHDEQRSAAAFDRKRLEAAILLLAAVPGLKMLYQGQIEGRKVRIPVQLTHAVTEEPDLQLAGYYERVLSLFDHQVTKDGEWELAEVKSAGDWTFENMIACSWSFGNKMRLLILNFSPNWSQARVLFRPPDGASPNYRLLDQLTGERYSRSRSEAQSPGLHVILDAYQAHLFDVSKG